jgi:uncharacterized membrane protein
MIIIIVSLFVSYLCKKIVHIYVLYYIFSISISCVHRDSPVGLPVVLCVSMGRTGGAFEANVSELTTSRGMVETKDYWHFI